MCKQTLQQCRSGKDFLRYAEAHGAKIRQGHGSHTMVRTQKGSTVVPFHNSDLGTGLRVKLVKAFTAIGLALLGLAGLIYELAGI